MEVVNATNHDNYRANSPATTPGRGGCSSRLKACFPLLPVAGVLIEF
jgi:hypothetical protein